MSELYRNAPEDYAWAETQIRKWEFPKWSDKKDSAKLGDALQKVLKRHPRSSREADLAIAQLPSGKPDAPWDPCLNKDAKEKRRQLRRLLDDFSKEAGLPRQDDPRKIKMPSADYMSIDRPDSSSSRSDHRLQEIDSYRGRSRQLDETIDQLKRLIREVGEFDARAFAAFFSLVADSPASAIPILSAKSH